MNNKNVILLTGDIGVGKSTIANNTLKRLLAENIIKNGDIFGYKTVRLSDPSGKIEGFDAVTYGGERCPIASVSHETPHRYMKFFVNIKAFERTLMLEFEKAKKYANPIVHIDEIGLMEKISPRYINMLNSLIRDFKVPIIAVIKYIAQDDFLDKIKNFDNAELFTVTKINREWIGGEVYEKFSAIIKNR